MSSPKPRRLTVVAVWLDERGESERATLLRLEPISMTLEEALEWLNEGPRQPD